MSKSHQSLLAFIHYLRADLFSHYDTGINCMKIAGELFFSICFECNFLVSLYAGLFIYLFIYLLA